MKIKVLCADPAGTITLFVRTPVEKKYLAALAEKLMAMERFKAEPVDYCCDPEEGAPGIWKCPAVNFAGMRHEPAVC